MNDARITPVVFDSYAMQLGYKWDVMIITNHYYAGIGRFCETLVEAIQYCHAHNCKDILCWDRDRTSLFGLYDECAPFTPCEYRTPLTYDWSL